MIPIQSTDKNKIKISIHPGMINIVGREKSRNVSGSALSYPVSYSGRVKQLSKEKEKLRAVIDIGIPVSVLMEKTG